MSVRGEQVPAAWLLGQQSRRRSYAPFQARISETRSSSPPLRVVLRNLAKPQFPLTRLNLSDGKPERLSQNSRINTNITAKVIVNSMSTVRGTEYPWRCLRANPPVRAIFHFLSDGKRCDSRVEIRPHVQPMRVIVDRPDIEKRVNDVDGIAGFGREIL